MLALRNKGDKSVFRHLWQLLGGEEVLDCQNKLLANNVPIYFEKFSSESINSRSLVIINAMKSFLIFFIQNQINQIFLISIGNLDTRRKIIKGNNSAIGIEKSGVVVTKTLADIMIFCICIQTSFNLFNKIAIFSLPDRMIQELGIIFVFLKPKCFCSLLNPNAFLQHNIFILSINIK